MQNMILYNRMGIVEICCHSDQPKAEGFMDFCWEFIRGREFMDKLEYNVWKGVACIGVCMIRGIIPNWRSPRGERIGRAIMKTDIGKYIREPTKQVMR